MDQRDPQATAEHYRILIDRARIEGLSVWLDLLHDRLRWNEAPRWAQDQSILAVAEMLGPTFQFLNTDIYECGGQSHRIASFRYLGLDPEKKPLPQKNPLDWLFRLIPGGDFDHGSPNSDSRSAHPKRAARALRAPPFLIAATPTTQAMAPALGSADSRHSPADDRPIHRVDWAHAHRWLATLGAGLRLPYELEWEYACRSGTQSSYFYGDDATSLTDYAWYIENSSGEPQPVGQKKPNSFGLFDTHGNVWEWCQDLWAESGISSPGGQRARNQEISSQHVQRGGSFLSDIQTCRASCRVPGSLARDSDGFRIARSL